MFPTDAIKHVVVIVDKTDGTSAQRARGLAEQLLKRARGKEEGEAGISVVRVELRNARSLARARDEVTRACNAAYARLVDAAEQRIASALSAANLEDTAVGV